MWLTCISEHYCQLISFSLNFYGNENLTIKARDATRLTAADMKYVRRTAGYTWKDDKTNTEIANN
jgi:hypothetical protein